MRSALSLVLALAVAAGIAGVWGTAPAAAQYAWFSEVVDEGAYVGTGTSLAFDALDRPHVAYVDENAGAAKYAVRNGSWATEVVHTTGYVTPRTSLVLDDQGQPHLTFADGARLWYANRVAATWNVSIVDRSFVEGSHSLALGRDGLPRVAYAWDTGRLRFAAWNGTAWAGETVETDTVIARHVSLVLDGIDRPNIAYAGNGQLRYSRMTDQGWVLEIIDPVDGSGMFSRLRLDDRGWPRIAYYTRNGHDVRFAEWDGQAREWSNVVVDSEGDTGWDLDFAIDGQGAYHLSYYERGAADLRYASKVPGGTWTVQLVDAVGVVGWYSSVGANGTGFPGISYFDWTRGALRFAESRREFQVRTLAVLSVGLDRATIRGSLTSLGDFSAANVSFEWREAEASAWIVTQPVPYVTPATVLANLTGLRPDTVYEYRVVGEASGILLYGDVVAFRTRAPSPPPPLPIRDMGFVLVGVGAFGLLVVSWLRQRRRDRFTPRGGRPRRGPSGALGAPEPPRRTAPAGRSDTEGGTDSPAEGR